MQSRKDLTKMPMMSGPIEPVFRSWLQVMLYTEESYDVYVAGKLAQSDVGLLERLQVLLFPLV